MLHPTVIKEFMVIYRNLFGAIPMDFGVRDHGSLPQGNRETLILYQHTLVVSNVISNKI